MSTETKPQSGAPVVHAQSGVSSLIQGKVNAKPGEAAPAKEKKFIIMLSPESSDMLDHLARATRTGKIALASELFAVAIKDGVGAAGGHDHLKKTYPAPDPKVKDDAANKQVAPNTGGAATPPKA